MSDIIYRSVHPDLEVRSKERLVRGIAVPYNKPVKINRSLTEQFRNGVFNKALKSVFRVPFSREHIDLGGRQIGKTQMLRNDAKGMFGEWKVAKTELGDDTLALIEDDALHYLSVGFKAGQNRRLPGGVIERVTGALKEVAVTLEGAYGEDAAITEVRGKEDEEELEETESGLVTPNLDQANQILAGLGELSL